MNYLVSALLTGGLSVDRGWHTPAKNSFYKQLQAYHCLAELWGAAVSCIVAKCYKDSRTEHCFSCNWCPSPTSHWSTLCNIMPQAAMRACLQTTMIPSMLPPEKGVHLVDATKCMQYIHRYNKAAITCTLEAMQDLHRACWEGIGCRWL